MSGSGQGRVALVTGAGRGLGRAFAERLAADGFAVAVLDVDDPSATEEALRGSGARALGVTCDITDEGAVAEATARVERELGAVDVLVSNAGVYPKGDLATMSLTQWRSVFAVNVEGAFLITRALLPGMRARGWGRIVYLASASFHAGSPGFPHYVATKGALIGLAHALATEVGDDGVTVNALAPSIVATEGTASDAEEIDFTITRGLQAIRRTQRPQDVVGALSFLVSPDAGFMTGQTLVVDGGLVRT